MPTQVNKPSTSSVGSLSLGKNMFQTQGPFLFGQAGVKRLHIRLPFLTITISMGNFGLEGTENPAQTELACIADKVQ